MLKRINRILKLVGLNLVRAKKPKAKVHPQEAKVPLSDYMGECEWQSTPPIGEGISTPCAGVSNPGKTHFVGDDCPGGHTSGYIGCGEKNTAIGYQAQVQVVNPDANFVPVDIGCNDHEMTRVEQPNSDNKITGPTS